jgi:hypothetical protein
MELCLKRASEIELARYAREGFAPMATRPASAFARGPAVAELRRKMAATAPANPNDTRAVQAWIANAGKMAEELMAQDARLQPPPAAPQPAADGPLNLHKSWHVLHYLFTGRAWDGPLPAATLLLGGREIGRDLGYGKARIVAAADTSAFAQFLSGLSAGDLKRRLDMRAMQKLDIYCAEGADDGSREELEEDVERFFPQLQAYVDAAARDHRGLVIWMS